MSDMGKDDLLAGVDTTDPLLDDTSGDDRGDNLAPATGQEAADGGDHGSNQQRQQPDQPDESEGSESAGAADADGSDQSDGSEETGGDDEGGDKQPQQDHRIPKSRFDEVNRRRKEAERRLKELERQQQAQDPAKAVDFDFDAKEQEYMQAVLDGETDKALEIRKEIRSAEAALHEAKVQQAQQEAQHKTKAQLELEQAVVQAQQGFPEFDASSDVYDEEATQEALELFEAYKGRGYMPADAMNRAVRMTAKAYGLGQKQQQQGEQAEQQTQQKQQKQQKQAESLDEKMKTAERQPPAPSQQRDNAELPNKDPARMSEKEFDALDEEERRRLRGDFG